MGMGTGEMFGRAVSGGLGADTHTNVELQKMITDSGADGEPPSMEVVGDTGEGTGTNATPGHELHALAGLCYRQLQRWLFWQSLRFCKKQPETTEL